jgi:hypothetical protein
LHELYPLNAFLCNFIEELNDLVDVRDIFKFKSFQLRKERHTLTEFADSHRKLQLALILKELQVVEG